MWPMSDDEVSRNDLLVYEPLTHTDGPAMIWSMHSIGHMELSDFDKVNQFFQRSYQTYVRAPFNVSCLKTFFPCCFYLDVYYRYGQKFSKLFLLVMVVFV